MRSTISASRSRTTPILEDYSLSVDAGAVLAILGANGVGKTTLLNCIVGLAPAERRDGRSAAAASAIVPQLFHATFAFSVLDIVLMGRARHIGLFGAPRARDYQIARKYLELMRVGSLAERPFNELSGGQRQLVMIAQALASECEIMVLDEPCSALDYKNQSIVIDSLRRLNADMGLTIVFTTHAPQHGLEVASHVLLMNDRRRYRHGTVEDVLTAENLSASTTSRSPRPHFAEGGDHSPSRPPSRADRQAMTEPTKKIAYLTWGAASQITSFQDFAEYLDDMIYLRELETHDLSRYAAVVVPDGMDRVALRRHAAQLNAYVRGGGFLVIFGCGKVQ